jgi:hypothetical protein
LLYSETKQKTLEEIAAAFGDKVVLLTERDIAAEETVMEEKARVEQVEVRATEGHHA